jgi:signal transduction histidine kinase
VALQASLLDHRERFTQSDFTFLAAKLTSLSRASRVVHDDFDAQLFSGPKEPVSIPDALDSPALIENGAWFVAPLERGAFRGVSVDLDALLEDIAEEMRSGGLLGTEDRLATVDPIGPQVAVADLRLAVDSKVFADELALVERRHALKTAIGVALGALVVLVAILGALLYWRQRRYLEGKASFIATVSHELRTPLASLRLMGETLERRLEGIESAKDFPSRIVGEADRLSFLVENILSFNRLEHPVTTNRQSTTVEELVDSCRPDIAAFTKKPVELAVTAGRDVALSVDPALARLLFSNLVHNACKYNDRDSIEITVQAVESTKETVLGLSDNGTGIAKDEWERVFTEFVRAKNNGRTGGFGLGLALCRRILRLHDGTIRVADSSNAGTTFEMVFPNPEKASSDG